MSKTFYPALLMLLMAVFLVACGPGKRTPSTTPDRPRPERPRPAPTPDPEPPIGQNPKSPRDSMIVPTQPEPPKLPETGTPQKGVAKVSMMMPFFSQEFYSEGFGLPQNSEWALQYFAGVKMGLMDLEARGQKAELHVYDSEGSAGIAQQLVSEPDIRVSDALIAPYLTQAVKAVVDPAKSVGLPLVVPFSAAADLAQNYPELVQLNPGLLQHLDALALHLQNSYDADQVILLGLPNGQQDRQVSYLLNRQKVLDANARPWRTWRLENSNPGMSNLNWEGKFHPTKATVFVFPNYTNPEVLQGFMAKMVLKKGSNEVRLFGMPQWVEFQELDYSVLERLNTTITTGPWINYESGKVRDFMNRFGQQYGRPADLPAFLGYDAIRYIVPLINKHGRDWTEHLPASFPEGLVSDYRIKPMFGGSTTDISAERSPARRENSSIQMLEFRDQAWRLAP